MRIGSGCCDTMTWGSGLGKRGCTIIILSLFPDGTRNGTLDIRNDGMPVCRTLISIRAGYACDRPEISPEAGG